MALVVGVHHVATGLATYFNVAASDPLARLGISDFDEAQVRGSAAQCARAPLGQGATATTTTTGCTWHMLACGRLCKHALWAVCNTWPRHTQRRAHPHMCMFSRMRVRTPVHMCTRACERVCRPGGQPLRAAGTLPVRGDVCARLPGAAVLVRRSTARRAAH